MTETGYSKCECRHCGGHIEFPAEAAGQTVPCPHCGRLTGLPALVMEKSRFQLLIFGGIALLVLVGLILVVLRWLPSSKTLVPISIATNAPATPKLSDEIITNQFSVSNVKLDHLTNSSLIYVTGKVRNLAAEKRYGVKLEFSLQTASAASAGKASDYASSLDPSSDWNFKALVLDSKATSVRFSSILETK